MSIELSIIIIFHLKIFNCRFVSHTGDVTPEGEVLKLHLISNHRNTSHIWPWGGQADRKELVKLIIIISL